MFLSIKHPVRLSLQNPSKTMFKKWFDLGICLVGSLLKPWFFGIHALKSMAGHESSVSEG